MTLKWVRQTPQFQKCGVYQTLFGCLDGRSWEAVVWDEEGSAVFGLASVRVDGKVIEQRQCKTIRAAKMWATRTLKANMPAHVLREAVYGRYARVTERDLIESNA